MSSPLLKNRATICLVLLGLADLLLTIWLLGANGKYFREVNPVAAWCLRRCGWVGLVALKAGLILLVCALLVVVARRRPGTARRVLVLGCVAQAGVVLYSAGLAAVLPLVRATHDLAARAEVARADRMDAERARTRGYVALRGALSQSVIEGRRPLAEAVTRLKEYELCRDARWMYLLARRYPGKTGWQCLEAQLVEQIEIDLGAVAPPRQELLGRLRAGLPPVPLRAGTPVSFLG
jgi:hypothetical protein